MKKEEVKRIIIHNGSNYIYIYEEYCGYEPKGHFTEFISLSEAMMHTPDAQIMRYPSKKNDL